VYYYRAGTGSGANKWYIHHQGGGWCVSLADCYGRSLGDLGSSKNYPKTADLGGGYFSTNPSENPQMYNWNAVFLRYCDGGSFSGNNDTETKYQGNSLYFRGFKNLQAMFNDLFTNRGLNVATDVVISGCSAGGLATFLHVDWWKDLLLQAKVVGMPDSGFFLDWESDKHYHDDLIWVFNQMNSTSGLNSRCINAYVSTDSAWRCIFAQYTSPFIVTPIFPLQSEYDSWQVANELDSTDAVQINKYGDILTLWVTTNLLANPKNGIFLDSCFHHCGSWGSIKINGKV